LLKIKTLVQNNAQIFEIGVFCEQKIEIFTNIGVFKTKSIWYI